VTVSVIAVPFLAAVAVKPEGAAATATVTLTAFEADDDWPAAFTAVT